MSFPVDNNSLYAQKIYDEQVAASRCYAHAPINVVEGFGMGMSMENIIKIGIVILLVILFISLICDYGSQSKEVFTQAGGAIDSYFELTPISMFGEC
jgi:hypothetical protein